MLAFIVAFDSSSLRIVAEQKTTFKSHERRARDLFLVALNSSSSLIRTKLHFSLTPQTNITLS